MLLSLEKISLKVVQNVVQIAASHVLLLCLLFFCFYGSQFLVFLLKCFGGVPHTAKNTMIILGIIHTTHITVLLISTHFG